MPSSRWRRSRAGHERAALLRVADAVIANGIDGDGAYRAVRDMLLRLPPRRAGGDAARPWCEPGEDVARRRHDAWRSNSTAESLPIQGPPGTGKTYAAARMVIDLVAAGKTVAITAQSHKTISNLLEAIMAAGGRGAACRSAPSRRPTRTMRTSVISTA